MCRSTYLGVRSAASQAWTSGVCGQTMWCRLHKNTYAPVLCVFHTVLGCRPLINITLKLRQVLLWSDFILILRAAAFHHPYPLTPPPPPVTQLYIGWISWVVFAQASPFLPLAVLCLRHFTSIFNKQRSFITERSNEIMRGMAPGNWRTFLAVDVRLRSHDRRWIYDHNYCELSNWLLTFVIWTELTQCVTEHEPEDAEAMLDGCLQVRLCC